MFSINRKTQMKNFIVMPLVHTNIENKVDAAALAYTVADLKNSVLIVSVLVNLFVLTAWLVAKTSPVYAAQLVGIL